MPVIGKLRIIKLCPNNVDRSLASPVDYLARQVLTPLYRYFQGLIGWQFAFCSQQDVCMRTSDSAKAEILSRFMSYHQHHQGHLDSV